jgi:hypothetical protein
MIPPALNRICPKGHDELKHRWLHAMRPPSGTGHTYPLDKAPEREVVALVA